MSSVGNCIRVGEEGGGEVVVDAPGPFPLRLGDDMTIGVIAKRNKATAIAAIVIVPSSSAAACSQVDARGVTRIRGGSSSSG
jgi:hypothetical protein